MAVLFTGLRYNYWPGIDIGFSPDLVWIKERTGAANNRLFDSVRGPGKT